MTDIVTPEKRTEMMRGIRSKNTSPEILVRRWLHRQGFRFRLHRKDLPGSPDIVLPSRKIAIFVHGCFWHRHEGCRLCYMPKSNLEKWAKKFSENEKRDRRVRHDLETLGWKIIIIWECQVRDQSFPSVLQVLGDTQRK